MKERKTIWAPLYGASADRSIWVIGSGNSRGLGQSHPEDQDELEGVVEGEPVNGIDHALKHAGVLISWSCRAISTRMGHLREESKRDPVLRGKDVSNQQRASGELGKAFCSTYRQPLQHVLALFAKCGAVCGRKLATGKTYLGVIDLGGREESFQRVVAGEGKADDVDEELAGDVEEDKEEVDGANAEDGVDLGHIGLLLEVDERRVLGQLYSGGRVSFELERCGGDDGAAVVVACRDCDRSHGREGLAGNTYLFVELGNLVLGLLLERHGGRR